MTWLRRLLCLLAVAAAAFVVADSVLSSYRLIPTIPYLDHLYLQSIFFWEVDHGREWLFPVRLTSSNEHLMLLPMPLYFLDNEVFAARGTFLVTLIQLVNALVAASLTGAARRAFALDGWTTAAAGALFAAAMFWSIHGVNLFWPKQMHMYAMLATWIVGVRCAARADGTRRWRDVVLTLLCFSLSLYSFGYGIAAMCGLLAFAAVRWEGRQRLAVIGTGVALLAFYWWRMERPPMAVPPTEHSLFGKLWIGAEFFVSFLGYPVHDLLAAIAPGIAPVLASIAGGVGAVAGAWVIASHLRRRRERDSIRSVATLLLLAALVGAALTSVARWQLGPEGARADRYAMVSVTFWAGLLLGVLARLPAASRPWALVGVAAVVFPLLVPAHVQQLKLTTTGRDYIVAAEMAVLNGVVDAAAMTIVHPDFARAEMMPRVARGYRERQWGVFAGPQDEWIGRRLRDVFPAEVAPISGFVLRTQPAAGGGGARRVDGHAFDRAAGEAPTWIAIVDAGGIIVGVGHRVQREVSEVFGGVPRNAERDAEPTGWWVGYVPAGTGDPLTAYGVRGDGTAALLQR